MMRHALSRAGGRFPSRFAAGVLAWAALALVAACATPGPQPEPPRPDRPVAGAAPEPATVAVDLGPGVYTPPHLAGRDDVVRVALLLPFSSDNAGARAEATQLRRAAELALFERAGPELVLLPKDTGGTLDGGRRAAAAAISDGADLVLGPLLADAVEGAAERTRAAGVPMIAFSTRARVAGDGVFLLSFPPAEEVRRVVEYAAAQGAERFAFIGPASPYGAVVSDAYRESAEAAGGYVVAEELYFGGVQAMTDAARRLAELGVEPIPPQEAALMTGANWSPAEDSPFQVVMLPEGGDDLRMLGPVLLYEDIDPLKIKFLGTGLWNDPAVAREPALNHGWFAGPDPAERERFAASFEAAYGETPSRLAGLGYDAASLAAFLARDPDGVSAADLEAPDGFLGVDGLFRFRSDGTIERGLAVYAVRSNGFRVIDPAPQRFDLVTVGAGAGVGTDADAAPADVEAGERPDGAGRSDAADRRAGPSR